MKVSLTNLIIICLTAAAILSACKKPDQPGNNPGTPQQPQLTKVQFATEGSSLPENGNATQLELVLDKPAARTETVTIEINAQQAVYGTDFTTTPEAVNGKITLTIQQGEQRKFFSTQAINNDRRDAQREIRFRILSTGTSLKPEGRIHAVLNLMDDDDKATVGFSTLNATIAETLTTGYEVELRITPAASEAGIIEITTASGNAVYGQHYTTAPALTNGKITVPVAAGAGLVKLKVIPVNDQDYNPTRAISFNITGTSENLQVSTAAQFRLQITNEDPQAVNRSTIASIRNSYTGMPIYFVLPVWISGIVTSVSDNIAANIVYVQDGTGGIAIRFTANHSLRAGELVSILLEGGNLTEAANGALEIRNIPLSAVTKDGWDLMVVPEMSISDLYNTSGNKEGQLVLLRNVQFTEANGSNTLQGDRSITDGVRTAKVRTENFASFRNGIVPAGRVSITGILIEHQQQYIILPLTGSSIF